MFRRVKRRFPPEISFRVLPGFKTIFLKVAPQEKVSNAQIGWARGPCLVSSQRVEARRKLLSQFCEWNSSSMGRSPILLKPDVGPNLLLHLVLTIEFQKNCPTRKNIVEHRRQSRLSVLLNKKNPITPNLEFAHHTITFVEWIGFSWIRFGSFLAQ